MERGSKGLGRKGGSLGGKGSRASDSEEREDINEREEKERTWTAQRFITDLKDKIKHAAGQRINTLGDNIIH